MLSLLYFLTSAAKFARVTRAALQKRVIRSKHALCAFHTSLLELGRAGGPLPPLGSFFWSV